MKVDNFQNLIRLVTGRDFTINTQDVEIQFEKEYTIFRKLQITYRTILFT